MVFLGSSVAASAVCSGSFWNLQHPIRGIPLFLGGLDLGAKDKPGLASGGSPRTETAGGDSAAASRRLQERVGGLEPGWLVSVVPGPRAISGIWPAF